MLSTLLRSAESLVVWIAIFAFAGPAVARVPSLGLVEVLLLRRHGALVVDLRPADVYAAGHLRGSVNLGLSPRLAEFGPRTVPQHTRIVIVAPEKREDEAASALARAGFTSVAGVLAGGMGTVSRHPRLVERSRRLSADELARELAGPRPPIVLDVRTASEHAAGRIPGAVHIPLEHVADRASELPAGRRVVAHCGGGYRSSLAASLLRRLGRSDVDDLAGGYEAWRARSGAPR